AFVRAFADKTVVTGKSLPEALRLVERDDLELAIVDLELGARRQEGLVVVRAWRAAHPDRDVILMSGYARIRSAVEAMRAGAIDVLEKPVSRRDVIAAVDGASPELSAGDLP